MHEACPRILSTICQVIKLFKKTLLVLIGRDAYVNEDLLVKWTTCAFCFVAGCPRRYEVIGNKFFLSSYVLSTEMVNVPQGLKVFSRFLVVPK